MYYLWVPSHWWGILNTVLVQIAQNIHTLLVLNKLLIYHFILCFCETSSINDKNQSRRNLGCKGWLLFSVYSVHYKVIIKGEKVHSDGINWVQSSPLLHLMTEAKPASEILNNLKLLKTICNVQYNNFIMKDRSLSQTFSGSSSVHVYVTIL